MIVGCAVKHALRHWGNGSHHLSRQDDGGLKMIALIWIICFSCIFSHEKTPGEGGGSLSKISISVAIMKPVTSVF